MVALIIFHADQHSSTSQSQPFISCESDLMLGVPMQAQDDNDDASLPNTQTECIQGNNLQQQEKTVQNLVKKLQQQEIKVQELEKKLDKLQQREKIKVQDLENKVDKRSEQLYEQLLSIKIRLQENQDVINQKEDQIKSMAIKLGNQTEVVEKYEMNKKPHGIAVIINNYEFPHKAKNIWCSSQLEEESLCTTWKFVHYKVISLHNLSASSLIDKLKQIALTNHGDYDSFVCCILSYGNCEAVCDKDGKMVKINDIVSIFKCDTCPTLANKPKLFFVLTLHNSFDNTLGNTIVDEAPKEKAVQEPLELLLFKEVNFFFAFSTGNSWRSRFHCISKLCEVFKSHASQLNLLSMLTILNNKLQSENNQDQEQYSILFISLLHKQLWFCEPV